MKKIFFIMLLLSAAAQAQSAEIVRGPYVENVSPTYAVVHFRVDTATNSWLTYGFPPNCDKFQTYHAPAAEHKYTLFGLSSEAEYCYRIYLPYEGGRTVYKADEAHFYTFKQETTENPGFTFMAFGQSGTDQDTQLNLADAMFAQADGHRPDFVLHTGGSVSTGLDEDADDQYFSPYEVMLSSIPFFLTLSTEAYGESYREQSGSGFLAKNYNSYHSVPYTGQFPYYYYFDIDRSRIIVLDDNDFFGAKAAPKLTPGTRQYKWLEAILAGARRLGSDGKPEKEWVIISMNHPVYSTGQKEPDPGLKADLEPLFLKYGVDIVLQGYNRNYERTRQINAGGEDDLAGGIVYITLGGGGQPLEDQAVADAPWSAKFIKAYSFAVFDIKDNVLDMNVYDSGGNVIDGMHMEK